MWLVFCVVDRIRFVVAVFFPDLRAGHVCGLNIPFSGSHNRRRGRMQAEHTWGGMIGRHPLLTQRRGRRRGVKGVAQSGPRVAAGLICVCWRMRKAKMFFFSFLLVLPVEIVWSPNTRCCAAQAKPSPRLRKHAWSLEPQPAAQIQVSECRAMGTGLITILIKKIQEPSQIPPKPTRSGAGVKLPCVSATTSRFGTVCSED